MDKIQRTTDLLSFGQKKDRIAAAASGLCMQLRANMYQAQPPYVVKA
jgi:hypothetical protein